MRKAASIIKMGAVLFVYALGSAFISQTAAGGGYGLLGGGINKEAPGWGPLGGDDPVLRNGPSGAEMCGSGRYTIVYGTNP